LHCLAVEPFYDFTLDQRTLEATREWEEEAQERLEASIRYEELARGIDQAFDHVEQAINALNIAKEEARTVLSEVELPEIDLPEANTDTEAPEPLFTSDDDFVAASHRLIEHKNLR
jgi:hypothetical protein